MPRSSPRPSLLVSNFESLEKRQMLASVNIANFGAVPNDNRDDTSAINLALRSAAAGDTITVPAGTFNLSETIVLNSGETLKGVGVTSKLDFQVGRAGYAIQIAGSASNVTIDSLALRSNCGIVDMRQGSGFTNINITNNDLVWGYAGSYYNRLAVNATVKSTGLIIEKNFFHDSSSSDRNVNLWSMTNGSYSFNKFFYVNDGGHILQSVSNVRVVGNIGRKIHRMGIEIQGLTPTNGLLVSGNVFFDWDRPWNDTFGLSVMPMRGTNIQITNNYLSADFTGDWGESMPGTGGPRFGIAIEAGFTTGIVAGNTVIGPWATGVAAAMANTKVDSNKFYGSALWSWIMGEPGVGGHGSYISTGNIFDSLANAPRPPEVAGGGAEWPLPMPGGGGGGGAGGDIPTPTPDPNAPKGMRPVLSFYIVDSSRIRLSWTDGYNDENGFRLERSTDGKTFTTIYDTKAPGKLDYQDKGLPSGTKFYYRVYAYKGTAAAQFSNVIAATTKGQAPGGGGGVSHSFSYNPGGSEPTPAPISSDPLVGLYGDNGGGSLFSGSLI